MKTTQLIGIAAQAETIRLGRGVRRVLIRSVLGMVAAFFGFFGVVYAEIAACWWLETLFTPPQAALLLMAANFVVMVVMLIAFRLFRRDAVAREARAVRDTAIHGLRSSVAAGVIANRAARMVGAKPIWGMLASGVAARFFSRIGVALLAGHLCTLMPAHAAEPPSTASVATPVAPTVPPVTNQTPSLPSGRRASPHHAPAERMTPDAGAGVHQKLQ